MGEEVSAVVGVGNLIMAAVGVTAVILFGVWRIVARYEIRNDGAHEKLGERIDRVQTELGERIDGIQKELSKVSRQVGELIGRQTQRDVDQLTPDK